MVELFPPSTAGVHARRYSGNGDFTALTKEQAARGIYIGAKVSYREFLAYVEKHDMKMTPTSSAKKRGQERVKKTSELPVVNLFVTEPAEEDTAEEETEGKEPV